MNKNVKQELEEKLKENERLKTEISLIRQKNHNMEYSFYEYNKIIDKLDTNPEIKQKCGHVL